MMRKWPYPRCACQNVHNDLDGTHWGRMSHLYLCVLTAHFLCLPLPDSLWPQLQLGSGVWWTELIDTVETDPWEMKLLHKQHTCTYTTHKSTYRNYAMMYSQFNGDFGNILFCSGMLAWRAGEGAQWKGTGLAPAGSRFHSQNRNGG